MPGRRVLIVEDDADLRLLYRTALLFAGFEVLEAADGLGALQQIDRNPPLDAVILDLGLPTISGAIVRNELAAHAYTRHIPVIVVTGQPGGHQDLDVACVLTKPVTPDRLVAEVRRCLALRDDAAP